MVVPYGITIFECMHTRFSLTKGCIHLGKIVDRREPVENGDIPASYVRKYQKVGYVCLRHFSEKKSSQPSTLGLTLRSAKLIGLHNVETSPPLPGCWLRQQEGFDPYFFGGGSQLPNDRREVGFASLSGGGASFASQGLPKKESIVQSPNKPWKTQPPCPPRTDFFYSTAFFSQESGGTNNACKD